MQEHTDDTRHAEKPASRWEDPMTWVVLLVAGWLLYELTTQPMLAAAAICLKFGWEDFRAAWWLRRTDPHGPRGRACFALYVASGLWKTAITASIMFFAMAVLLGPRRAGAVQAARFGPPPTVLGVILAAFGAYTLLTLSTCRALWLAWRHRVKLWLDEQVHSARRHNRWPPYRMGWARRNKAHRLILTSLFVVGLPVLISAIVVPLMAFGGLGARPGQNQETLMVVVVMAIVLTCMFAGPVGMLLLRDLLARRVIASTPSECWGTATLDEWDGLRHDEETTIPGTMP